MVNQNDIEAFKKVLIDIALDKHDFSSIERILSGDIFNGYENAVLFPEKIPLFDDEEIKEVCEMIPEKNYSEFQTKNFNGQKIVVRVYSDDGRLECWQNGKVKECDMLVTEEIENHLANIEKWKDTVLHWRRMRSMNDDERKAWFESK